MRLFCFVPMLFLYCFMASLGLAVKDITTDQSALLAFKAHIDDHRSVLTNNWSISYPVCSWVGISCSARHHRVTALNLSIMGLQGTIPPHLGNLSFLVYLNMSHNYFHGHLPNELGQLHRLRFMSFTNNSLSGSFPSWIGSLSRLRILALGINNFTGPIPNSLFNSLSGSIPSWIGIISKLQYLSLYKNNFTGPIPNSLFNLSNLERLDLSDNHLQGEIPTEIGNLQNMEQLSLNFNNLSGPIPPSIFNISTITLISLTSNKFSGHLPSTLGETLPNIQRFFLSDNKLTGTIPNSITNASKLTALDLGFNSFSGLIPNTFGNLRFLRLLSLAKNYLTTESSTTRWSFLSSLTNCINLYYLALASNPLRGTLPPLIGNLSEALQHFYAYDCKLSGNIPQEIGHLRGLIMLSLFENDLIGTIPTTVGRLKQLQALDLHSNILQGSIPYDICQLKGLYGLNLKGNRLSGHIPECLGSLTSLRELFLGSNNLTSSIPLSFWSLEYILKVDFSSNSLSGPLPSNVQNLKVLLYLNLSRNQLSGDIPMTISELKDLKTLSLAGNQFQGLIPGSFGNLISLESLDLSGNNLCGEIPKSLEALSHLKQFNVSHNKLEGEIPTNGPFTKFSSQSFVWNSALCGPPRLEVPPCKENNGTRSKKATSLVLKYVLPPLISIVLIVIIIVFFIRRRNMSVQNPAKEDLLPLATWRRISYLDIQRATNGFNECNLLGTGSFGTVYKGTLSDGTNVAVKVFNLQIEKAFMSFDSECEILRSIRHRNLIKILSSCCMIDFKALVLEFMPNGSLEKWLHSHNYFLDIIQRLNIMIDVGLALEYLHHGHSLAPIVHCDLKPSNILLDENMTAHVSDFGISKLLDEGNDFVTRTMTMATIGYMAPEYGSEGFVSARCDVYSYGVLLMETFTRKKPTDGMFTEEMNLKNWVKESLPYGLSEVVDANLLQEKQAFSLKMDCLLSIMHLALDCCMESPNQRIFMTEAVTKLKKIKVKFLDDVAATN